MPAAQTVTEEPTLNLNSPPTRKPGRVLLACLFLVFVLSSLFLLYLLKNPSFDFARFFSQINLVKSEKIKVQSSPQELAAALELEKAYREASPSSSSPSTKAATPSIEFLARQRITADRILEIEGQKLGLDMSQIRKDSLPVLVTREGVTLSATASASLYGYEQSLYQAVKERVEGYVEKQVLAVVFLVPKLATKAQRIGHDILPLMEKGNFDLTKYSKEHPLDKGLSFFSQVVRDPLKIYPDLAKLPVIGEVKIAPTPFSFDLVKITKIEKGLGTSFEEWYQNVKKKYL